MENNTREALQGLTWKSLKHRKDLQPLFIIMGLGALVVGAGFIRCGLLNPENNWRKAKDPVAPMAYYKDKRHKLVDPKGLDYKNLPDKRKAPKYIEVEESN